MTARNDHTGDAIRSKTAGASAYAANFDAIFRKPRVYGAAPFVCGYCGRPCWTDPSDQRPPPEYCHESDHGSPE